MTLTNKLIKEQLVEKKCKLKYDAFHKDWTKKYLLIIYEGKDFKGWQVDFLLPDNSIHQAFVPMIRGYSFGPLIRRYNTPIPRIKGFSILRTLGKWCSRRKEHVVNITEVNAPECFDSREWVFYRVTRRIEPRNRYNFDGSLYVLVDDRTFSAADIYADAVKRIGLGKLVGRNTSGGCAAYLGPPVIRLPASGMIFQVETEIVINPDGRINELFGTRPDVKLPPAHRPRSITKEDLLKDAWIEYIIHET